MLRLMNGSVLEAPYGSANLPILQLSDSCWPVCCWMKCFSFTKVTANLWKSNVLAAWNQNLTVPQKELLHWHHRLSHAGLSTIHNLCRQKRQTKVDSLILIDLLPICQGAMLPCTFNVPGSICNGLLCAVCSMANATHRAPYISGVTSRASKEMILKEDHVDPGDCISCDHFLSPVPGCMMASSGHTSSANGYTCGTIFVDHSSGYTFIHNQRTTLAQETIHSKFSSMRLRMLGLR